MRPFGLAREAFTPDRRQTTAQMAPFHTRAEQLSLPSPAILRHSLRAAPRREGAGPYPPRCQPFGAPQHGLATVPHSWVRRALGIDIPEQDRVPRPRLDFKLVRGKHGTPALEARIEVDENRRHPLISGVRKNVGMKPELLPRAIAQQGKGFSLVHVSTADNSRLSIITPIR